MNSKRMFFVMTGVLLLLLILIAAATVGGNTLLQKRSDKLYQLKINHKALQQQQVLLLQAKKDIEKYGELNQIARSIVPQDKDQAKTVREINSIALQNSISLKSIDFDTSNLGEAAARATQQPAEESAQQKTSPLSQVKPVAGIPGVYSLEIRTTSAGEVSYESLIGFLEGLEKNRRTAHVTKVDFNPRQDGRRISFSITLNAYIKP